MNPPQPVPAEILSLARQVAKLAREAFSPSARVWLFGSWAKGTAAPRSDLDIAVELSGAADLAEMERLRGQVEELPTLRSIDLIDLARAGPKLRGSVLAGAIEL